MDNDTIRDQAKAFLAFAREKQVSKLDAQVDADGDKTRFIIERKPGEDGETLDEHVVVKVGPTNRPRTVVAAPAEWL